MRPRDITRAVISATLVPRASAAFCPWGFGGYAEPCGAERIGADDKVWINAVEASNSSGTYTMPGYDVSKPWPGTPMDGWTLSKTGVDLSGLRRDGRRGSLYSGLAVVSSDIKIIAPKSLYVPSTNASDHGRPVVNAHPDWIFCAWRWYTAPYNNKTLFTNPDNLELPEDGSCAQWLSDECIKAVEKQASTAYWINSEPGGRYGSHHTCHDLDVPDECLGTKLENNEPLVPTWGVPLQYLNGSTTWQGGYGLDENTTAEDIKAMWWAQTVEYQPIVTMFGHKTNKSLYSTDPEPGFAKLSCIRGLPAKGQKSNTGGSGGNGTTGEDGGNESSNDGDSKSEAILISSGVAVQLAAFMVLAIWVL
ncbi:uncharacterized protein CTRU02_208111 [Colletotrichum truncatum]|uniref:Uncharacterized protein n=1 Tax=Colletotrichum truncatum TaxID=5467 RepID=A0ACC3YYC4_COLTU